jgi:hypothetical protein
MRLKLKRLRIICLHRTSRTITPNLTACYIEPHGRLHRTSHLHTPSITAVTPHLTAMFSGTYDDPTYTEPHFHTHHGRLGIRLVVSRKFTSNLTGSGKRRETLHRTSRLHAHHDSSRLVIVGFLHRTSHVERWSWHDLTPGRNGMDGDDAYLVDFTCT